MGWERLVQRFILNLVDSGNPLGILIDVAGSFIRWWYGGGLGGGEGGVLR